MGASALLKPEELLAELNREERERAARFMADLISKRNKRRSIDINQCEADLKALWDRFLTARSVFSFFRVDDIGKSSRRSARFYRTRGKDLTVAFPKPLASEEINSYNDVAYWINQAYVASAYAILDRHKIVGNQVSQDPNLPGFRAVDLLRRVRMKVAHSTGGFNPEDKDHKKLNEELTAHFKLSDPDPRKFQLHIDAVLEPMLHQVIEYVRAKGSLNP